MLPRRCCAINFTPGGQATASGGTCCVLGQSAAISAVRRSASRSISAPQCAGACPSSASSARSTPEADIGSALRSGTCGPTDSTRSSVPTRAPSTAKPNLGSNVVHSSRHAASPRWAVGNNNRTPTAAPCPTSSTLHLSPSRRAARTTPSAPPVTARPSAAAPRTDPADPPTARRCDPSLRRSPLERGRRAPRDVVTWPIMKSKTRGCSRQTVEPRQDAATRLGAELEERRRRDRPANPSGAGTAGVIGFRRWAPNFNSDARARSRAASAVILAGAP